jgi:hypothetical protein
MTFIRPLAVFSRKDLVRKDVITSQLGKILDHTNHNAETSTENG